jgi:hypothetical protein
VLAAAIAVEGLTQRGRSLVIFRAVNDLTLAPAQPALFAAPSARAAERDGVIWKSRRYDLRTLTANAPVPAEI